MAATRGDCTIASTPVLTGLARPDCYPHPVGRVQIIETHISWVVLTGPYAYKIKKPVNLGFLDFSTLAARHRYCNEEVRLNRRLAPDIYLDVVAIRESPAGPRIDGEGPVLEYAVKMHEFPQEALAARMLGAGAFGAAHIDKLADCIVAFHETASPAAAADGFGSADSVLAAALQNFEQILPQLKLESDKKALYALRHWTEREFSFRRAALDARKRAGRVRECHGDLHLGNIAIIGDKPVPFDCIEFNEALRWIDVMSEIAFLMMDLQDRQRGDLAWRFLNRYLEATGDYPGLPVLRFYLVYRALVRAKVHLTRAQQPRLIRTEKSRLTRAFRDYLRLAQRFAAPDQAALIIAHGLSGCGKTTATQPLTELLGAVRLRSDLERKRLHGLAPLAASRSGLAGGIYTPETTAVTYRRLADFAQTIVKAGYCVIVDATFLRRTERIAFRGIAEQLDAQFLILNFQAPLDVLRARVAERRARADDPSEADLAVLDHQIAAREPLTPEELTVSIAADGTRPPSREILRPVIERLRRPAARHGLRSLSRSIHARRALPPFKKR
jgi:aminoglycoside phosphotransferase family enzyme/predicted kinase